MKILGIDPGTATTGYGLLKTKRNGFELVDFGWIKTDKKESPEKRLKAIHQKVKKIIDDHRPDVLAIERLFFATNAKTVIAVSQAHGVIMLAAATKKVPIVEYTPMEVKFIVSGSGKADKKTMKKKVRKLLSFRSPKKKKTHFDDVCDALAVAICHAKKSVLK